MHALTRSRGANLEPRTAPSTSIDRSFRDKRSDRGDAQSIWKMYISLPSSSSCLSLTPSAAPQTAINAEQTASPFSIMMYAFLDQMVFLASRVLHLSHDMLPPLADYDYTKNIVQKSFEACVYFSSAQPSLTRTVSTWIPFPVAIEAYLLGLMTIFRTSLGSAQFLSTYTHPGQEYFQMAILVIIRVISLLLAPVGMNKLLRCAF
jgi:hypothetical protein